MQGDICLNECILDVTIFATFQEELLVDSQFQYPVPRHEQVHEANAGKYDGFNLYFLSDLPVEDELASWLKHQRDVEQLHHAQTHVSGNVLGNARSSQQVVLVHPEVEHQAKEHDPRPKRDY